MGTCWLAMIVVDQSLYVDHFLFFHCTGHLIRICSLQWVDSLDPAQSPTALIRSHTASDASHSHSAFHFQDLLLSNLCTLIRLSSQSHCWLALPVSFAGGSWPQLRPCQKQLADTMRSSGCCVPSSVLHPQRCLAQPSAYGLDPAGKVWA